MTLSEQAQYIKGLMDGLSINDSTPEGKVLIAMSELIGDICERVDDIDADVDDIVDFCNTLDDDLSEMEEDIYGDDDDCDCDCDCGEEDCCEYSTVCPTCGDTIELTEDMLDEGGIDCPNCGERLEFDFDDCECDDCECEDCSGCEDSSEE